MITYSKIGKKGNLGNQLFQIASTVGLALEHELDYGFLPWQHQDYFKNKLPLLEVLPEGISTLPEKQFHHYRWEFESQKHYDLAGWLQSEQYFDIAKTKHYFEFEDTLVAKIKSRYTEAFQKKTILISIRRGDFVNHPDYLQTPIKFYLNALTRYFPDWLSHNLIVLSDDIDYCKFHFSFLDNAFFGDGLNAIEQLCLGTLCDDFVIGNSTFSWWSAWLGEKENSKVVCPHQNFDGSKRLESDDRDYFPKRWIAYNPAGEKVNLKEVVFHLDFKNNRYIVSAYLAHHFDTNIDDATNSKYHYFLKQDLILPPFLVYYTYLKKTTSPDTVVNNIVKTMEVLRALNYEDFSQYQDFGLFSSIFDFTVDSTKSNHQAWLESQTPSVNQIVINTTAGKFGRWAYRYNIKKALKKVEITIKKTIKKLFFPKKR